MKEMGDRELDDSSYDVIWEKAAAKAKSRADWWDHREISDPGVTLLEMWAVLCDMQSYYLNQIRESHYRGYLKLLGLPPDQGECSRVWILFKDVKEDCTLPAGMKVLADTMVFETESEVRLTANHIRGFFKGAGRIPVSGMVYSRKDHLTLGREKVLFSFSLEKPVDGDSDFSFFILLKERRERNPPEKDFSLVKLGWSYRVGKEWQEAEVIRDDTQGLLRSGCVCLHMTIPGAAGEEGEFEIQCSVKEGKYDQMPTLFNIALNATEVVQRDTLCCREDFFFSSRHKAELKSYLARTGEIQVFAWQREDLWKDITAECTIDPPIREGRQRRYVSFQGEGRIRIVASEKDFSKGYIPCPVTGVTSQQIVLPWKNILRDSVELMLPQGEEGLYREYRQADPEEMRYDNVWHWTDQEGNIALGDGRHGDIPEASQRGVVLTSLALFEGIRGNVAINRIKTLRSPELFRGLTCKNYMPGKGGRDSKSPSEQFREVRDMLMASKRIVTKDDAALLAKETPGLRIAEAQAEWRNGVITVIICPKDSLEEEHKKIYKSAVEKYLEQYRPIGTGIRVEIGGKK